MAMVPGANFKAVLLHELNMILSMLIPNERVAPALELHCILIGSSCIMALKTLCIKVLGKCSSFSATINLTRPNSTNLWILQLNVHGAAGDLPRC